MSLAGHETTLTERATQGGRGLEIANAINCYLTRANGDVRLALALSVSDRMALAQAACRPARPGTLAVPAC